jgi:hypothetical protein
MSVSPSEVCIGQSWSAWTAGRQQWLLATVVHRKDGQATLKYDARYGIPAGDDERHVDETTLLGAKNLFRYVERAA